MVIGHSEDEAITLGLAVFPEQNILAQIAGTCLTVRIQVAKHLVQV